MLQSILAIAVLLTVRRRMRDIGVGRLEAVGPGRSHGSMTPSRAWPTTPMKNVSAPFAFAAVAGFAGIIVGCAPAYGHDWYPLECCARNDCMPANAIEADGSGGMTVIVGDLRIGIPGGFVPRTSPDSRVHVCFRMYPNEMDGNIIVTPVCLFLPVQA